MKQALLLFIIFVALFGQSCRKELPFEQHTPPDTLFPRPYLPIYPGSWWTYRNASDSTTFTEYAGGYVLDRMSYNEYNSQEYYVPLWRGRTYFGYGFYNEGGAGCFTKELDPFSGTGSWLYEPNPGDPRFSYWNVWRKTDSTGLTLTIDSVIYTDVIKVVEYEISSGSTAQWDVFDYYYAKDVGLIRVDKVTIGLEPKYYLIDHFINH